MTGVYMLTEKLKMKDTWNIKGKPVGHQHFSRLLKYFTIAIHSTFLIITHTSFFLEESNLVTWWVCACSTLCVWIFEKNVMMMVCELAYCFLGHTISSSPPPYYQNYVWKLFSYICWLYYGLDTGYYWYAWFDKHHLFLLSSHPDCGSTDVMMIWW